MQSFTNEGALVIKKQVLKVLMFLREKSVKVREKEMNVLGPEARGRQGRDSKPEGKI